MIQTISKDVHKQLEKILGKERVRNNILLAPFTTFKIGGPAQFFFEALSDDDLVHAVKSSAKLKLPITILGGTSNVIISDAGIKGLVVINRNIYKTIVCEEDKVVYLKVSSGYSMTRLAKETAEDGLTGLEFHLGLPGTVGGALFMNSKWTNPVSYVGDTLTSAKLINPSGEIKIVNRDYFQFGYDQSILQKTKEIVIWAQFRLKKAKPQAVIEQGKKAFLYRKQTQPFGVFSSGCFFRNADGRSAGELIDKSGLKGFRIGGARVSDKHANFIINFNHASSDDIKKLISHIKREVYQKHNIKLQEEVVFI